MLDTPRYCLTASSHSVCRQSDEDVSYYTALSRRPLRTPFTPYGTSVRDVVQREAALVRQLQSLPLFHRPARREPFSSVAGHPPGVARGRGCVYLRGFDLAPQNLASRSLFTYLFLGAFPRRKILSPTCVWYRMRVWGYPSSD